VRGISENALAHVPAKSNDALECCSESFGAHWCLPGSGLINGRQAAEIAERHLGRPVKLRSAGMATLRIVSLFNKDCAGCCRSRLTI
jgi:hypothetical protein